MMVHHGEYNPFKAARAELVELEDHMGMIKTWGEPKEPNKKQAFLELVDYFAFDMSCYLYANEIDGNCVDEIEFDSFIFSSGYNCFNLSEKIDLLHRTVTGPDEFYDSGLFCDSLRLTRLIAQDLGYTIEGVYKYYFAKSELTKFRQKNGYKTGEYVKVWCGREDNEWLYEMIENGAEIEKLQAMLEQCYIAAIKGA